MNQAKRLWTVRIGENELTKSHLKWISLLECGANAKIKTGRIDIPDDCNVQVIDPPKTHLASIIGRKGKAAEVESGGDDDLVAI